MRLRIAAIAALLCTASLGACVSAGPLNRSIPLAARDKIAATDVVMPIGQNEMVIAIPISTAGASGGASFGLVGALVGSLVDASVDASNASAAETSAKPLRDALIDFNFDNTLAADLQSRMAKASWMNPGGYRVVKEVTPQNLEATLKASKAAALLFVSSSYALNFNADELTITLAGRVLPNTPELQALLPEKFDPKASQVTSANELYRNVFVFTTAVPNATNNRDVNVALWSANNAAPMREAMKLGSMKLTDMLVADLIADPAAPLDPKTTSLKPYNGELGSGYVLARDDVGTHVLQISGHQLYVTDLAVVPLINAPAPSKPKSK